MRDIENAYLAGIVPVFQQDATTRSEWGVQVRREFEDPDTAKQYPVLVEVLHRIDVATASSGAIAAGRDARVRILSRLLPEGRHSTPGAHPFHIDRAEDRAMVLSAEDRASPAVLSGARLLLTTGAPNMTVIEHPRSGTRVSVAAPRGGGGIIMSAEVRGRVFEEGAPIYLHAGASLDFTGDKLPCRFQLLLDFVSIDILRWNSAVAVFYGSDVMERYDIERPPAAVPMEVERAVEVEGGTDVSEAAQDQQADNRQAYDVLCIVSRIALVSLSTSSGASSSSMDVL